jgi:tetratricopeptide (TPR) repeat protein
MTGEERRSRAELEGLFRRTSELEAALAKEGKSLNANQTRLRNRILVLLGNTHFVTGSFRDALEPYNRALQFNPDDYYALGAVAQCYRALGDGAASFSRCLNAIERSGDLRRKRERITRGVIAVMAANAARDCGDQGRYEQYTREARDILGGNLAVDTLSPKFFSPATKRFVSSEELLREIEPWAARASTSST